MRCKASGSSLFDALSVGRVSEIARANAPASVGAETARINASSSASSRMRRSAALARSQNAARIGLPANSLMSNPSGKVVRRVLNVAP